MTSTYSTYELGPGQDIRRNQKEHPQRFSPMLRYAMSLAFTAKSSVFVGGGGVAKNTH